MKPVVTMAAMLGIATLLSAQPAVAEGDAAAGAKVFNKCKACHALEAGKNKIGPTLAGVIGRKAGSVEGFKYSGPMKDAAIVWDEQNLAEYLADPKGYIPKNKMAFKGLKKEKQRADVIAYMKQASSE